MKKNLLLSGFVAAIVMTASIGWTQEVVDETYVDTSIEVAPSINFQAEILDLKRLASEESWGEAKEKALHLLEHDVQEHHQAQIDTILSKARYELLFSKTETETSDFYTVKSGDYLGKIAKKNNTTVGYLKRANGLKSDVIRPGMKLKFEKVPFSLEVFIKRNEMWLKQGNHYLKRYPISTGDKDNKTPEGSFEIVNKVENPTWYYNNEVIAPGDPKNGLGTRWIGFDEKGYGIHGTIEPDKIGRPASLGCIRMYNNDVEEVFDFVLIGATVVVQK